MQPKKQLKVGIFEEMYSLKEGQKIWAWVDPPYSGNAREKTFFFY